MNKKMLIDASYKEETRVVILDGNCIESYDIENSEKKQLKGNIYLAKIVRIEPSLQAAFVDYGGNRHGFLTFSEIHPDYYQIPVADRKKLLDLQELNKYENESAETDQDDQQPGQERNNDFTNQLMKNYKIQEVIHKRQILLVQVVKEERGNKGAALTTYLSLAGRYCVLMPNSLRNGGISRKITSPSERKRLKDIITELNIPAHMGMIIRTAGSQCPKADTLKDGEYLLHLWDEIRNLTMKSIAPALIYEDSNLLKLALRDIYTSDINEILIDGEEAWGKAKDYMRSLMPQNIHKLHLWRDQKQSLFSYYKIEHLIDQMLSPIVQLKSGGYLVINQTEALVAIDVNSGRSIKEKDLEETALRTNQEAASEIARQLRLRDLAGLIVIDFIDMENKKHNYLIERRFKSYLHKDRARIQVGSISPFGLLEMTRQRLRPSIAEFAFTPCPHCNGTGIIRTDANIALQILRQIDEEARKIKPGILTVSISSNEIALYILNQQRNWLADIEKKYRIKIDFAIDSTLTMHQVKFVSKEDSTLDQEPEVCISAHDSAQDNLFVREIPIQPQVEYYAAARNDAYPVHEEPAHLSTVIDVEIETPQPIIISEEKENAIPFYPIFNQKEDNSSENNPKKERKSNHHTRRNRYRKSHSRNREEQTISTNEVNVSQANGSRIETNVEILPAFPEAQTGYGNEAQPAYEKPMGKAVETTMEKTIDIPIALGDAAPSEEQERNAPKKKAPSRTSRSRKSKAATVKAKEAPESQEQPVIKDAVIQTTVTQPITEASQPDILPHAAAEESSVSVKAPAKKTASRTRKTATGTKTAATKKTTKTASPAKKATTAKSSRKPKDASKAKDTDAATIQPIVIDDTPVSTPRAGWWKR